MASIGPRLYFFIIIVHQLDDYFSIRLTIERIAMLQQLFFQFSIVLDDTVMYAKQPQTLLYLNQNGCNYLKHADAHWFDSAHRG